MSVGDGQRRVSVKLCRDGRGRIKDVKEFPLSATTKERRFHFLMPTATVIYLQQKGDLIELIEEGGLMLYHNFYCQPQGKRRFSYYQANR
jgi:hypothetical protein